jgi:hypothetical protein
VLTYSNTKSLGHLASCEEEFQTLKSLVPFNYLFHLSFWRFLLLFYFIFYFYCYFSRFMWLTPTHW